MSDSRPMMPPFERIDAPELLAEEQDSLAVAGSRHALVTRILDGLGVLCAERDAAVARAVAAVAEANEAQGKIAEETARAKALLDEAWEAVRRLDAPIAALRAGAAEGAGS